MWVQLKALRLVWGLKSSSVFCSRGETSGSANRLWPNSASLGFAEARPSCLKVSLTKHSWNEGIWPSRSYTAAESHLDFSWKNNIRADVVRFSHFATFTPSRLQRWVDGDTTGGKDERRLTISLLFLRAKTCSLATRDTVGLISSESTLASWLLPGHSCSHSFISDTVFAFVCVCCRWDMPGRLRWTNIKNLRAMETLGADEPTAAPTPVLSLVWKNLPVIRFVLKKPNAVHEPDLMLKPQSKNESHQSCVKISKRKLQVICFLWHEASGTPPSVHAHFYVFLTNDLLSSLHLWL